MADQTVTLVLDAAQYYRELAKISSGNTRLSQSGEEIGRGFLRGDRAVRVATANITQSLLGAQSVGDATVATFQSLERVFRIPIGATIGVAAGIGIFAFIQKESKAADASIKKLSDDLNSLAKVAGPEKITSQIQTLSGELQDAATKTQSIGNQVRNFLDKIINPLLGTSSKNIGAQQLGVITQGENELRQLGERRVFFESALVEIKREELGTSKEQASIDKITLDTAIKQASIDEASKKRKLELIDLAAKEIISQKSRNALIIADQKQAAELKRIAAIEGEIEASKVRQIALVQRQSGLLKQQQDTAQQSQDFFKDVGSGKFAKDFEQKKSEEFQRQAGRDLVNKIKEGQKEGFFQNPLSQAILKEAERISDRAGTSIKELANTDFSNLLELSKYDFSGLQPLNGLTLSIQ